MEINGGYAGKILRVDLTSRRYYRPFIHSKACHPCGFLRFRGSRDLMAYHSVFKGFYSIRNHFPPLPFIFTFEESP